MPSQFSHEILNANPYAYLDDAPLEERRARAVRDAADVAGIGAGRSGQTGSGGHRSRCGDEAWPDVRDADELHDVLHTLVALADDLTDDWGRGRSRPRLVQRSCTELWQAIAFERLDRRPSRCESLAADDRQLLGRALNAPRLFPMLFRMRRFEAAVRTEIQPKLLADDDDVLLPWSPDG